MAQYPRVREQHIAVFGESGSGKTVLLSSFFGPTQERSFHNDLWDLVADDTGQGNRLFKNYVGMRDDAEVPPATRFASTTYTFSLKLKGADDATVKRRPFDVLRLAWHDYPGEWFEESPGSAEEEARRVETFRSLLRSDVALLLVDGQRLKAHPGEEERYLKSLLTNVRQGVLRIKDDLLAEDGLLTEFPRIWIIALSKADLHPDLDVYAFRDLIVKCAADEIEAVRETLGTLIEAPEALSVGEDFMLLSSAKFELQADRLTPERIDVSQRVGVDLVLPVASLLPLERRVEWSGRLQIPRRVLDTVADGADHLALALTGEAGKVVKQLVSNIPRFGPLAGRAVVPLLTKAAEFSGAQLREANERARRNHDTLTATLTQFKLDLETGVEKNLLIKKR